LSKNNLNRLLNKIFRSNRNNLLFRLRLFNKKKSKYQIKFKIYPMMIMIIIINIKFNTILIKITMIYLLNSSNYESNLNKLNKFKYLLNKLKYLLRHIKKNYNKKKINKFYKLNKKNNNKLLYSNLYHWLINKGKNSTKVNF
jgi:hypothetical protein